MVDKKLHSQMVALCHRPGSRACTWDCRKPLQWQHPMECKQQTKQPLLFYAYKDDPLSEDQKSHYLHLNILANNVDNKILDKIRAKIK